MIHKPTASEIQEILAQHAKWLRGESDGRRANLSSANLSSANLRGAYLSSADLSGANLSSADLSSADLSRADLRGAYLSSADLSGANLSSADLSGANLSSANLRGAYLSSADLYGANLRGANLSSADLYVSCADHVRGVQLVVFGGGNHRAVAMRGSDGVMVQIGCQKHPLKHWLEHFRSIGREYDYSEGAIVNYGLVLKLLTEWGWGAAHD